MCDNVKRCNINNVPEWGVLSGFGMLCIVNNTNITNIRGLGRKFGTGRDLGHTCGTLYCPIMMTLLDNLYLGCEERIQDVSKKTLAK